MEYVGEMQYRFVACTSYRFHQVYLDAFGGEALTSIVNAVVSVSCTAMFLDSAEEPDCHKQEVAIFNKAAKEGKLEILIWGVDSGYKLNAILDEDTIAYAALNGHLEMVKYLRKLHIPMPWHARTCRYAAENGHLELLKWVRANQCPWDEWTC